MLNLKARGSRRRFAVVALATAAGSVASACAYDWTGAAAPDAGIGADGASADATLAPSLDGQAGSTDGGGGADASLDAGNAKADGGDAAGVPCATLLAKLRGDRASGQRCTTLGAGSCTTRVTDECGCGAFLGSNAAANAAYMSDLTTFTASGCSAQGCPPTCAMAPTGTCLDTSLEAGAGFSCFP